MNYFTKDLSVIAKEILAALYSIKDRLTSLRGDLQEHTHAITEANARENEKQNITPEVFTESRLPKSIEIHKSASDTSNEEKHHRHSLFVQWCTFLAVFGYAVLVYFQYREMINATDTANLSVNEARNSRRQAERALNASIDASRMDQRAWVGTNVVGIVNGPIEANKPIIVGVNYLNTGKTPALEVDAFMNPPELMVSSATQFNFSKFNPPHGKGTFVLFPGASNHLQETVRGIPRGVPQPLIEDIKNGASTIAVYGIIRYRDIFSTKEHWTHFCLLYSAPKNGFAYCNTYNDTDDDHPK